MNIRQKERIFFPHAIIIHASLHIAARSTEFEDAGLEGKDEGAPGE